MLNYFLCVTNICNINSKKFLCETVFVIYLNVFRMSKGKIEDTGGTGASFSIKMQFNSEEQWTKALKFMLTNLKWGLAWVSSQFVAPS